MPFSCAASRASAICFAIAIASSTGIGAAFQALGEVLAFGQLHGEEARRGRAGIEYSLLEREEARDVGVRQGREQLRLALETGEAIGIGGEGGGKHLERDIAAEAGVGRAPDLTHPPSAEGRHHLVGTDAATSLQGQRCRGF